MIQFVNKKCKVKKPTQPGSTELELKETDYKTLVGDIISVSPVQGFTLETMKQAMRISATIESSKKNNIEFTQGEVDLIKARISETKWIYMDKTIIEFMEYINSLK